MLLKNETATSAVWQQVSCSQLPLETTLGQELPCSRPCPFREWLASDGRSKRYKGLALFSQHRNSSEGSSSFRTPCSSAETSGGDWIIGLTPHCPILLPSLPFHKCWSQEHSLADFGTSIFTSESPSRNSQPVLCVWYFFFFFHFTRLLTPLFHLQDGRLV